MNHGFWDQVADADQLLAAATLGVIPVPAETARKYQVLPLSRSGATLTIAMADPTNVFAIDEIKLTTGYNFERVVASEGAIDDAITGY